MFTSFRQRLLFCFILIISVSFVIIALTHFHLIARNAVLKSTSLVETVYILLLKDVSIRQDFFDQDTRNPSFFISGKSKNIDKHKLIRDSIRSTIDRALLSFRTLPYTLDESLIQVDRELIRHEALFDTITAMILTRGYKDHNLEGSMRNHIHWLEKDNTVPDDRILSLRRHEKDYIIRNEPEYVRNVNVLAEELLLGMLPTILYGYTCNLMYSNSTSLSAWMHKSD
jgi:adenylate cyclase